MTQFTLKQFESIGAQYAYQLEEVLHMKTPDDLWGSSLEEIYRATQIDKKRIQEWLDLINLYRIPKLSARNAELLVACNINSVEELAHRQAIRIFYKLKEIDEETYLIILQLPNFAEIDEWIFYAKLMTKSIKNGLNIPLVLLPMLNIEKCAELAPFEIYTIEHFLSKEKMIRNIRKIMKLSRAEWKKFMQYIDLVKIEGVDVAIGNFLYSRFEKILETSDKDKKKKLQKLTLIQILATIDEQKILSDQNLLTIKQLQMIKQKISGGKE